MADDVMLTSGRLVPRSFFMVARDGLLGLLRSGRQFLLIDLVRMCVDPKFRPSESEIRELQELNWLDENGQLAPETMDLISALVEVEVSVLEESRPAEEDEVIEDDV